MCSVSLLVNVSGRHWSIELEIAERSGEKLGRFRSRDWVTFDGDSGCGAALADDLREA